MISFGFVKRSSLLAILSGQPRQAVVSKERTRTRTVQVFALQAEASPSLSVVDEILVERLRQIHGEKITPRMDDEHDAGDLAAAAAAYALYAADELNPYSQGDGGWLCCAPPIWPWNAMYKPENPRRALVKAAALIVAEIERIDRLQLPK